MARKKATKKQNKKTKEMGRYYHKETVIDGIKFDSQTEAEYYEYLKQDENVIAFERQQEFILQNKFLIVNGERIEETHKDFKKIQKANPGCTIQAIKYIADFVVTYKDGSIKVIDVKGVGMKTPDFKLKEKMFNYMYPQYNKLFCVVKYKGEWLDYDEANKIKNAENKIKKSKK